VGGDGGVAEARLRSGEMADGVGSLRDNESRASSPT